ncbi:MAG: hypothetical protein ABSA97_16105 [Verrucomicrobiia bacterium]|jgi:hypothetical protein
MTTKKAKIKTAAKRNRTVPAREYRKAPKRNSPIPAHDATADIRNSNAWTISVEAGETAYIADNVSLYVVIQNRGPGIIGVPIRNDALQKIVPGGLWVVRVGGALSVVNVSSASALVQIDFLPKFK